MALAVAALGVLGGLGAPRGATAATRSPAPSSVPSERCAAGDDAPACTRARYALIVAGQGVPGALVDLAVRLPRLDAGTCHQIVHEIGRAAARRHDSVATTSAPVPWCGGGFLHGVAETVVVAAGRDGAADAGRTVCALADDTPRMHCAHGLGHGFLTVLEGDLVAALGACDALGPREGRACAAGVFMQNHMAMHEPDAPAPVLDPARPLWPCTELGVRYATPCYERQVSYALELSHGDRAAVLAQCRSLTEPEVTACLQGVGREAAQQDAVVGEPDDDALDRTARACDATGATDARRACLSGAVKALLRWTGTTASARRLCAVVGGDLPGSCEQDVATYAGRPEQ